MATLQYYVHGLRATKEKMASKKQKTKSGKKAAKVSTEEIMSLNEFLIRRECALDFLNEQQGSVSWFDFPISAAFVAGSEGSGWRTALEEGEVTPEAVVPRLSGWRLMDFSGLPYLDEDGEESEFLLERVWVSPEGEWFGIWTEVEKELSRCTARNILIDNALKMRGKGGTEVERLTEEQVLEAACARFERDGLWVGAEGSALTEAQAVLVADAALDFFKQVTHTIASQDLHSSLVQGFVSFRERGRGRFDMNVPALDGPEFDFLRRADAPWMPLVRAMLGADEDGGDEGSDEEGAEDEGDEAGPCKLIHMGVFLSMPGSEDQVYHADGVHQSFVGQLPPHALNVFVPLIDMSVAAVRLCRYFFFFVLFEVRNNLSEFSRAPSASLFLCISQLELHRPLALSH